jgi:hypothetical protein
MQAGMNGIKRGRRWAAIAAGGVVGLAVAVAPGSAAAKDRNHDGIPDSWEKRHGLSLDKKQTRKDQDSDKLNNVREFKSGLDPRDSDSDDDGVEDGDEGAGTITAYDTTTGVLTISVFGGQDVTGTVTDETEVKCDDGDDDGDEDSDGEGGDHSGPGHGGDDDDEGDDDEGDDEDDDEGDDDSGDDQAAARSDDDDEGDDEHNCSVDNLTVGAIVQEAELELEHGSAIWDEIELLK